MDSQYQELHFVLLPHLASGHMIPMMDMARLLARRGLTVTVVTTPINSARFVPVFDRAARSGLRIELLQVPFPSAEAGLPEGCESMDSLPSRGMLKNLLLGISMLRQPVERLLHRLQLRPSCIIADKIVMWADQTAREFGIPRIVFDGSSCFSLVCTHNIVESKVFDTVPESEPFVVPGLPDRIELTRAQLPGAVNIVPSDIKDMRNEIRAKELAAYGVVVNTFEELEPAYIRECRRVRGKVWCIGPVSLCNEDNLDKAERGNKSLVNDDHCLKWLDLWGPSSVIYACLGSLNRLTAPQLIELGLGLEACGRPFIWVVRGGNESRFVDWISESGFEERIEGRGILIRGWAPQVLILSHPAVGGFLTHCGWNSTLEGAENRCEVGVQCSHELGGRREVRGVNEEGRSEASSEPAHGRSRRRSPGETKPSGRSWTQSEDGHGRRRFFISQHDADDRRHYATSSGLTQDTLQLIDLSQEFHQLNINPISQQMKNNLLDSRITCLDYKDKRAGQQLGRNHQLFLFRVSIRVSVYGQREGKASPSVPLIWEIATMAPYCSPL
ncbi:UDP-glycosyltransferase 73C1-like isoform X1 [Rhodamnia argentea]|uniref:UDP-glycosyltransferase 73C1-like isoform X1 n=1 Tax=Rhodamnia argentea TaxID=178133 RepID=A0ABM3GTH2_9MYRT|nr:UDP-glycosyltransferase 73C1-like isoform X1 [Rhodamnia argentea]